MHLLQHIRWLERRLADLPELGVLNRKQIAALVGVAPLAKNCGILRGKRWVWDGLAPVRAVLYMFSLRLGAGFRTVEIAANP